MAMIPIFGGKLRKAREKAALTQAQLAKLLGCSPPRISEWERGVRTPKPLTQEAIFAKLKRSKGNR